MTERQKIIAHKIAIQSAKNILRQIAGIEVLEIYEENENQGLNELYSAYTSTYEYDWKPSGRLSYRSSEERICSWIIDTMGLKETEYFLLCGLWCRIKILDLKRAVSSLWKAKENVVGFLLAETDLSRIVECGCDSRDEDNYLIDIWEKENPQALSD